jgi:hypothetical protein
VKGASLKILRLIDYFGIKSVLPQSFYLPTLKSGKMARKEAKAVANRYLKRIMHQVYRRNQGRAKASKQTLKMR